MSGKTSSHEFSGNTTCILYYKAFQRIWLKTILQWGMPSFCCWNKLRLLTKLLLCFDVHDVNWFSIQLSWNSIHTDTDCESSFSLWKQQQVVIVISWCELLLLHFPFSCIFSLIPICYCQSDVISHAIWIETQVQCADWAESQIIWSHCIICISAYKQLFMNETWCESLLGNNCMKI